MKRQTETHDRI